MIDVALKYVRDVLDAYLVLSYDLERGVVVLNRPVMPDGDAAPQNQNKLVLSMVHLEHETARQNYGGQIASGAGIARLSLPVRFNVQLLISASFDDYAEALKQLTAAIGFFQLNPVLTRARFPDMPSSLDQLQFEVQNLSLFDVHNLWSSMGSKYLPSILYKMRHVTVDSDRIRETERRVRQLEIEAVP